MSTRHIYRTLKFVITVAGEKELMQDFNFVIIERQLVWSSRYHLYHKNLGLYKNVTGLSHVKCNGPVDAYIICYCDGFVQKETLLHAHLYNMITFSKVLMKKYAIAFL